MVYAESNKTQLRTAFASGLCEGLDGMLSWLLHGNLELSIRVGFGCVLVTSTKMRQKNKAAYEKLPLTHRTYKVLVRESDILECWYT